MKNRKNRKLSEQNSSGATTDNYKEFLEAVTDGKINEIDEKEKNLNTAEDEFDSLLLFDNAQGNDKKGSEDSLNDLFDFIEEDESIANIKISEDSPKEQREKKLFGLDLGSLIDESESDEVGNLPREEKDESEKSEQIDESADGQYGDPRSSEPLFNSEEEIYNFLRNNGVDGVEQEEEDEANVEQPVYAYTDGSESADVSVEMNEDVNGANSAISTDHTAENDDMESSDENEDETPFDFEFDINGDDVGSTDMNLRIAFGLEGTETDEVQNPSLKKFGDKLESDQRTVARYIPDHYEFTDPSQARDIAEEFRKKKKSVNIRLTFSILLTLALLVYENISVITGFLTGSPKQFAGAIDPASFPVSYVMASLQLMLFSAALAAPELLHGIRRLLRGLPTPESITAVIVAAGIISSACTAATSSITSEPVVYNAAASAAIVMTLIYSRLCVKRNMMAFFVAGSKKKKHAMTCVIDEEIAGAADDADDYSDVMKVERADFIDGFFSRVDAPDKMATAFVAGVLGVSAAAAILLAVFTKRGGGSVSDVIASVYTTLLCMLPLSAYLIFSYPFYRASSAAAEQDCAIIGEISVSDYSSASMVTLDDSNVFPSYGVKVQNIRIYNNARIDRVLYYASSIFSKAGGPLADVFEVATMEMGRSDNVEILEADRGYLAASADGVHIAFGSYAALVARGFSISDKIAEDDVDFSSELSIMYMFREQVLIAKMYVKYVLDGDIETTVANFKEYGMYVCVRTYDPNIDEDMIISKMNLTDPPVRVVKYRSEDEAAAHSERSDSGMVTFGSPKALIGMLPYCDQVAHTKRTCAALSIMSVIISLMLLAIFSMASKQNFVNSLFISLYHSLWLIPTYLASKIFIR